MHVEFRLRASLLTRLIASVGGVAFTVSILSKAGPSRVGWAVTALPILTVVLVVATLGISLFSSATISETGVQIRNALRPEVHVEWDDVREVAISFGTGSYCGVKMLDGTKHTARACAWPGNYATFQQVLRWLSGHDSPLRLHYTPRRWGNRHLFRRDDL